MKVLITGTHFTPALALINEFKKRIDIEVVYVGRGTTREGDPSPSQESIEIPKLGVKFIPIVAGRLQRSFTIYTIPSLLKIPVGFIQAFLIVLKEKPDAILSFGGYVGVPIVFAGWLLSKPIIIHEQTLVSGLANKVSSLFADKIAVSFKKNQSLNFKTILTGNPLRDKILYPDSKVPTEYQRIFSLAQKEKLPVILIMGGNQGSHTINKAAEGLLKQLNKMACVIHVTGDSKFDDYGKLKKIEGERYLVKKWIGKEFGAILKRVDLVISRAGINTLSELAYFGIPVLTIPIPYLYQDEQSKNAKFFEKLGLVKILPQSKLTSQSLLTKIKQMLNDLNKLKGGVKKAKGLIIEDAAKRLALETYLLAKNI